MDGVNNHDCATATREIKNILEGTGRFQVDVCTYPDKPEFSRYAAVVSNFNSGHAPDSARWPRETEQALVAVMLGGDDAAGSEERAA